MNVENTPNKLVFLVFIEDVIAEKHCIVLRSVIAATAIISSHTTDSHVLFRSTVCNFPLKTIKFNMSFLAYTLINIV